MYTNDNDLNTEHIRAKPFAPLPRYAHQLVYDSVNKVLIKLFFNLINQCNFEIMF